MIHKARPFWQDSPQTLEQYLQKKGPISSKQVGILLMELLQGFSHLYGENNTIHGNIHPEKIIFCQGRPIQLLDQGTGVDRNIAYDNYDHNLPFSLPLEESDQCYAAPERGAGFLHPSTDCFSIGMIAIRAMTGITPDKLLVDGALQWRDRVPKLPEGLASMIDWMIQRDPESRPQTIAEVLEKLRSLDCMSARWSHVGTWIGLGLGLMVLSYQYLPGFFYQQGRQAQQNHRSPQAQQFYQWATLIQPSHAQAHYELGILNEDQQHRTQAKYHYQKAAAQTYLPAQNNLARLEILDGELATATNRLQQTLKGPQVLPLFLEAQVHKNLGWIYFLQGNDPEATGHLQLATQQQPDEAPAYCLWAKTLDRQGQPQRAMAVWVQCLQRVDSRIPEQDQWRQDAEKRLA
jgi:hypothetical protein